MLDQIGLDFAGVHALRPDAIMVRMPGFGLDGPWRENPAFAYVIEDASGLTWLTGYPDRNPLEPYSLGDPNAGVHALNALLLALEHRTRTGEGVAVEVAMVDAALDIAAEQVIEYSAYGTLLQRDGNRGPIAAPQNLYLSADIDEFGRTTAGSRSPSPTMRSGPVCRTHSADRSGRWTGTRRRRGPSRSTTTSSTTGCRPGAPIDDP